VGKEGDMMAVILYMTEEQKERNRARSRAWDAAHPERRLAIGRAWRAANREKSGASTKAWCAANPEKVLIKKKIWNAANRERNSALRKAWSKANRERDNANSRAWRKTNPERHAANQKRFQESDTHKKWIEANFGRLAGYSRAWKKANPDKIKLYDNQNRVVRNIRSRMYHAVKRFGKCAKTMKLVGCDMDWLIAWLEVSFKLGMTWENYGPVWHIDHVRPCSSFDLSDPQQQRLCFHFTNLQPLFARENYRKYTYSQEKVA
jgi:hypothetical protein